VKLRPAFASAIILVFSFTALASSQQPDAETIIRRSTEANDADWKADPDYDWTERDLQSNGGTKTFQDFMILGSPYGRLIEVNGKPLSKTEQQQEQQKLDAEIAKRRRESPDQRRQRISQFQKERKRDHLMMDQITNAFNFKLEGQQKVDGHDVYVLSATPKPHYQPPNMQSQALKGMEGKLWIDQATFHWVRVEAEVVHPVSIEGFLAKVLPGTRFELEKMPVDKGVWLPKHFSMKSQARVLFVFSHREHDDETYWNYHKSTMQYSEHASGK
jgi:hypothetical protein